VAAFDREQVEARIFELTREFVEDPDAVSRDAKLEDLDIASLDIVEIAQILEDEFGIELLGQDREDGPPAQSLTVGEVTDDLVQRVEQASTVARG